VIARQARQFLVRAVSHLAGEAGIVQFLDIGTGLPTMQNMHDPTDIGAPRHIDSYCAVGPQALTSFDQADLAVARQRPGATPWWRLNAAANENSDR
jgi:S-adenosyl methyltransferase